MNLTTQAEENLKFLISIGIEVATFEPTKTGLEKSIIDATGPVRFLFEKNDFHDYKTQPQGADGKVIKKAFLLNEILMESRLSLYRPTTKSGDPRMWFSNLKEFASPNDVIAIFFHQRTPYLLNLTKQSLTQQPAKSVIFSILNEVAKNNNLAAEELLEELRNISMKPLAAIKKGDTAIGHSIESALGISANSSKNPDYKGIEIKSGRSARNRTTLFAQVPNWSISKFKSSNEILWKFGKKKAETLKLYCTLSSQKPNSHGLFLKVDNTNRLLQEWHESEGHVASWNEELLIQRLTLKHKETFWIDAEVKIINGIEHFQLKSVEHTKNPIATQLMPLISQGVITMDHLIKSTLESKKTSEKGPLFKIHKSNLDLLFPSKVKYWL